MSKWGKEPEGPYLVHVSESDRKRAAGEAGSSPPSDINESDIDTSDDESASSGTEEADNIPGSQETLELDLEGVGPSDNYDEGQSPVDKIGEFDWSTADAELAEFMDESDSEAGSDTASDTSSTSQKSGHAPRSGEKRKYGDREDVDSDGDSDAESTLLKKQRIANKRSTGLSTVTPNSEQSLPTPGPTNDGEGGEEGDEDEDFEDELERELMEELESTDAG